MWLVVYDYFIVGVTAIVTAWLLTILNNLKFFTTRTALFILLNTILLGTLYVLLMDKRAYTSIFSFLSYVLTAFFILKINIYRSVLGTGLVYILTALGELLSYGVMTDWLNFDIRAGQTSWLVGTVVTVVDSLVVLIFGLIVTFNRKLKNIILNLNNIDKKALFLLCGYILGVFIFLIVNFVYLVMPDMYSKNIAITNVILMTLFLLISLLYILARQSLLFQYKENEQLKVSLATIQELSQELRRFKHNYLNILHGFAGYIENEEWEELKKYYNEIIAESQKINNNVFAIQKIKNYALLGLLSAKIKLAESRNVNVKLEVLGEIDSLQIKISELCEVLGIYLDNAIEAAELSKEKEVKIIFVERNDTVTIIVDNSCNNVPDISKILRGYSSKGKNRGFGLIIANQILTKYKDVLFNTYLRENNHFVQEIIIPKTNKGA